MTNNSEFEEPTFSDKRRVDPETGDVREGAPADAGAPVGDEQPVEEAEAVDDSDTQLGDEDARFLDEARASIVEELEQAKAETEQHKDALARTQADYVNYRNRIQREREGDRDTTVAGVVAKLLPALDDLDLARKHGDLEDGPMALIAKKLDSAFELLDVKRVGEVGEVFDTATHEAIAQLPSPDATESTVIDVVQVGYRVGDRLLRAAKVAVQVPQQ
ncbi:nucleotide exchange factor GrpE [Agrococcus casei]|uniref:Protein GrpE n=1 Tax=Agrococcus casei LMG 22410 TaxID=1255656 RepID=A0A1R4GNQ7_9MICO|nr:nucleotide exchange factor GrpE [Agrococcus casei]SJM69754.1 Heat shock protein GrpE [Agrococcus casei LMG 22410]